MSMSVTEIKQRYEVDILSPLRFFLATWWLPGTLAQRIW